ncbi:MAG: type II toxin-antitoxin system VapC family toxin [Nitrospirae bacterium]|nr:type II toxin-antitoxin system VapC family toxin [Nitrospirota bacterium]
MSPVIYIDTSAIAKWYINESRSSDVERYLQQHGPVSVSELTVVEMRCLLARRRRERNLTPLLEAEIFATFQEDIRQRYLICHPFPEAWSAATVNLMARLPDIPLRTLDAMHLVIAGEISSEVLATSDQIMAAAAKALGLKVVLF